MESYEPGYLGTGISRLSAIILFFILFVECVYMEARYPVAGNGNGISRLGATGISRVGGISRLIISHINVSPDTSHSFFFVSVCITMHAK